MITGLVTKGRGDSIKNQWVTKYKISYSNDSILWSFYKDANHLEPKVIYYFFFVTDFVICCFFLIKNRNLVVMQTNKWKEHIF
jgi:hypothetical protein